MTPPKKKESDSMFGNSFLDFLWQGGFRSLIVLAVVGGATWITVFSRDICAPYRTSETTTTANGEKVEVKYGPDSSNVNTTCNRYFELALLVLGGYFGLSLPSSDNGKNSSPGRNGRGTQSQGTESPPPGGNSGGTQNQGTGSPPPDDDGNT